MERLCEISVNGHKFRAHEGELLLDAALKQGVDLPHDCRAGHCGTCRVRLVGGDVQGGKGSEPGIVHACQCRLVGNAAFEKRRASPVRTVRGVVSVLRPVTPEVLEVGILLERALPYLPGQYAKVRFAGYPGRLFSITHPLLSHAAGNSMWFHIRRVLDGRVTSALGGRIAGGHAVELTGPFGSAHFRARQAGRLLLVATSTGFAPIWSIAAAALHENPRRAMMIIAGARALEGLYMAPALERLAAFPNVRVVIVCSTLTSRMGAICRGRPTDYLPQLFPSDTVYACGAPGLVDAIETFAARSGATCYSDPFLPAGVDAQDPISGASHQCNTHRQRRGVRDTAMELHP